MFVQVNKRAEYYMIKGKKDFQKNGGNDEDLDDPTISQANDQ